MAVTKYNKILYLDFYCHLPDGRKVRCRESTGFKDNKRNRHVTEAKDRVIKYELRHGTFDYLRHFPNGSKAKYFNRPFSKMFFSEWWDHWLSEKILRQGTEKGYDSVFRVHLGPAFGHYPISAINDHEIFVFRKLLQEKGLQNSTINDRVMKPLCMALYRAYKRGLISKYPCDEISRLTEQAPDIDPFSFDELIIFLDKIKAKKPDYYEMIFIWSRTGLRPGEMYALKWTNVDYFNKKILIRETHLSSGHDGPPKTEHSLRDIQMRPEVFEAFKRQEARTFLQDGYVFLTHANRPFSDAFMRKKFRLLTKLAGLKYRSPKHMRHTFATLHIAAGENITWVSKMLGHSSVEITLRKYNRFVPNLTREDGSAFENIVKSKSEISQNQAKMDI